MRLLITGLNGSLAPRLAAGAQVFGWQVCGWDRRAVDPDDVEASNRFLGGVGADAIAHLAMGSEAWAARLAAFAAGRVRMVFTSSAAKARCRRTTRPLR